MGVEFDEGQRLHGKLVTREREETFREILASNVRLNREQALDCLDTLSEMRQAIETIDIALERARDFIAQLRRT
jgi:hypothetical protein